jgi:predicted Abi (CAAX) family protease
MDAVPGGDNNPDMTEPPSRPRNRQPSALRAPADLLGSARRYLRNNALAGLRARLFGAPVETWALVPFFVLAALSLGLVTGRLEPELPSIWQILVLPPVLALIPTLVDEFFYRGILLPRSLLTASGPRRFWAVTASTALYVSAHPISPLLGLSESDFFLDPRMLLVVALLGYTCGYAYLRSGTLRAPMVIHWGTVVVWNLFLGGVY